MAELVGDTETTSNCLDWLTTDDDLVDQGKIQNHKSSSKSSMSADGTSTPRIGSPKTTDSALDDVTPTGSSSVIMDFSDEDDDRVEEGDLNQNFLISPTTPPQAHRNRSIEIFFGNLTTFHTFFQMLCEKGLGSSADGSSGRTTTVRPESVKKLVLVGHPMTSFSGLSLFYRLVEVWITNCSVSEGKWVDFMGLVHLHKLYIYNCQLNTLDPLQFQNLRVLWLAGNNLTSLSFLGQGLVCLNELNVARNDITCLVEEHLFKCVNLQRLNLSGNPICILQDVQAVKVLPNLESLYLADPLYGKCPVATICDSRAMFLSFLGKITTLDGRRVTPAELAAVQEYVKSRCLYYYANSVRSITSHVALRKTMLCSANKQMEAIGARLLELAALAAKYRRTISSVEVVPIFTNAKNLMKDQLMKIENRMMKLKEWKEVSTRRLEVIMQISRWEQEVEKWMKWLEFQSYGNIQTRIAHSVHGSVLADGGSLCLTIHEMISALACPGLWPQNILLKVETVMVVRDKGMEAGMERIYYDIFAYKDEPKFVPPPPDVIESKAQYSTLNAFMMSPTSPYCPPSPTNVKPVTTYTTPDYKPPAPLFPFPESVPGLPERSQPLFMFLVCPQSYATNPLHYLQKILTDRSRHFKDVRVTNCLWLSCSSKPADGSYAVVVIVKVLEECLQPVHLDKRGCSVIMRHSWDCATFSVKRPLAFAPAYVVNVSFTYENKQPIWHRKNMDDDDILLPAETALGSLRTKIQMHGHPPMTKPGRAKTLPHLKRIGDGFHADLASVQICVSKEGSLELLDVARASDKSSSSCGQVGGGFELHHVSKLLGKDFSQCLTSLDLSGNRLGLIVGLENVATLKKLNLSYNNLTTLSGLQKLPSLIELKVGWNSLRFLHSNISTLAYVSPRLMTVEILPNPFQDVRNVAHIPILLHKALPLLHRVDIWSAPFSPPNSFLPLGPPRNTDDTFARRALEDIWDGNVHEYNEMASKCLTDVTSLPKEPPLPADFTGTGVDLNLSDNYLSSASLLGAAFCTHVRWKTVLVKLQLQENVITTLDWLHGIIFPNCHILNLSINQLDEVDNLPCSFPTLRHLHLSGNPLPCDINLISSFRSFSSLLSLDCTSTPLASHPDYASFIIKNISTLQMLDGAPTSVWEVADSTEKLGGAMTPDWLEEKIGSRDWGSLQQLSLASSGLQKISIPPQALPKLLSLDLQDNNVTNLGVLSSLPSLKVLCVSHNNVSALGGNPCPVCYAHTAQSQAANAQKLRASKSTTGSTYYEWNGKSTNGLATTQAFNKGTGFDSFGMPLAHQGQKVLPCHVKNDLRNTGAVAWGLNSSENQCNTEKQSSPPSTAVASPRRIISKPVFPRLEVLIMAHNSFTSVADLHLHSMQNLQTIILNCNNLTSLQGFENLPCVRAIVLDHNRIRDVHFNSLSGCKSLKYLHLEHNRITSLPRFPHLTNLTALYLAYNKIQSLTDLNVLSGKSITELSMAGNPVATRSDYRLNVAARINQLSILDGKDLSGERHKLGELANKWFPQTSRSAEVTSNESTIYRSAAERETHLQGNSQQQSATSCQAEDREHRFSLRVKPLSAHLANNSPRSLQFTNQRQKRHGFGQHEN